MKLASFKQLSFWCVKYVSRSSMFSSNLKNAVILRTDYFFFMRGGGLLNDFFINKLHTQRNEFWFEIRIVQMYQLSIRDYLPYSPWQAALEKSATATEPDTHISSITKKKVYCYKEYKNTQNQFLIDSSGPVVDIWIFFIKHFVVFNPISCVTAMDSA